ncbi:hypothetical protein C7E15_01760 [Stenotrophomonas maltophilia]|nr:hypothetical protein C7E15_01760 [Stenotrophomonas maltophilia]
MVKSAEETFVERGYRARHTIMRWVVMQTSRIPRFPPDIEARLTPDAGDPCVRDASMNPLDLH